MNLADAFAGIGLAFSEAFDGPFHRARIIEHSPITYDDGGSITGGGAPIYRECMAQIDSETRPQGDSGDTGMTFIILASSLSGSLGAEARVEVLSGPHVGIWLLSEINRDTCGAGWSGKGRRG